MPAAMPYAMEYVNGITRMVRPAGTDWVMSSQSTAVTFASISSATTTSAMWLAYWGMAAASGTTASDSRNSTATTSATMPVRPPSSTPVADSTYVVTVEVPSIAPNVVPTASAISGLSASGRSPSSSRKPPACPTPTSVPAVSKKSTKKNVNTMSAKLSASTFRKPSTNAPASGVTSYWAPGSSLAAKPPSRTNDPMR